MLYNGSPAVFQQIVTEASFVAGTILGKGDGREQRDQIPAWCSLRAGHLLGLTCWREEMATNVYCVHMVPRGFTDLPEWISTATPKASLCYTFNTRGNWRVSHCHHLDGRGLRLLSSVSAHGSPTPLRPHLAICLHSSGTRNPAPSPSPTAFSARKDKGFCSIHPDPPH